MNWLAILCAGVAYWVLGFVWYVLLFGKAWAGEMRRFRGGQDWPAPTKVEMAAKMIGSFIANVIAAMGIAYILHRAAPADLNHALRLGMAAGVGLCATAITVQQIWESKPTKVWMIDTSYHFLGCVLAAAILFSWP